MRNGANIGSAATTIKKKKKKKKKVLFHFSPRPWSIDSVVVHCVYARVLRDSSLPI